MKAMLINIFRSTDHRVLIKIHFEESMRRIVGNLNVRTHFDTLDKNLAVLKTTTVVILTGSTESLNPNSDYLQSGRGTDAQLGLGKNVL